ncbi:shikimate kinase [Govanella unica]|uniref:Shikimate kinase n=1 Tax=Govanella unica TaxID=2975056 RepID=A0A9X3TU09_9PROT|nr:shikimate kinase [Govania unica]MDA5192366.1 shikimate kinase [Govania unica]
MTDDAQQPTADDAEPQDEALNETSNRPVVSLRLSKTIVLVGLMGAGKTTVGRRLATRLGLSFVDADAEIETAAGRSITEIFEDFGEAEFRKGERSVITRLLKGRPLVLATGGGAFMDPKTRARIKDIGISVWLKADIPLLVERVGRRNTRPLLRTGDPREILTRLAAERYPVYAEADITVESGGGPHDEVVEDIIAALRKVFPSESDSHD